MKTQLLISTDTREGLCMAIADYFYTDKSITFLPVPGVKNTFDVNKNGVYLGGYIVKRMKNRWQFRTYVE